MLTSLQTENFKVAGTFACDFERIASVETAPGGGRTLVFDALRLMALAERGVDTALLGSFASGAIATSFPSRISAVFSTFKYKEISYHVTMRRFGTVLMVLDERLEADGKEVLLRAGGRFHAGARTCDRRRIPATSFALSDAARYVPEANPLHDLRRELREMWLLAPDPRKMDAALAPAGPASADTAFACLPAYIALRTLSDGAVRRAMMQFFAKVPGAAITGFEPAMTPAGTPSIVVTHASDLEPGGVPFADLDDGEKMLFLAAFVCAVNETSQPLVAVWNAPANWLGDATARAVLKLLRRSFALRGQLVTVGS